MAVDIILSIITILGKHLLFCPVENLIEMVALSMNSLCFRKSNVNPYQANNIFVQKVSFATVYMYWIYTCLKAHYLI